MLVSNYKKHAYDDGHHSFCATGNKLSTGCYKTGQKSRLLLYIITYIGAQLRSITEETEETLGVGNSLLCLFLPMHYATL